MCVSHTSGPGDGARCARRAHLRSQAPVHASVARWALVSRIEYTGKGDNYWHIDNDDKQSAVHLVDARVSAEFQNVTLSAFAENLFDENYTEEFFAQQFSALMSDIRYPGTPRRYGLSAMLRF